MEWGRESERLIMDFGTAKQRLKQLDYRISTIIKAKIFNNLDALSSSNSNRLLSTDNADNPVMHAINSVSY